jgi:hypothetical protein
LKGRLAGDHATKAQQRPSSPQRFGSFLAPRFIVELSASLFRTIYMARSFESKHNAMNIIKRLSFTAATLTLRSSQAYETPKTPVLDLDFPDPFVLATTTGPHAYATDTRRESQRLNVRISRSSNGVA